MFRHSMNQALTHLANPRTPPLLREMWRDSYCGNLEWAWSHLDRPRYCRANSPNIPEVFTELERAAFAKAEHDYRVYEVNRKIERAKQTMVFLENELQELQVA